jgi:hypothetical protein
MHEHGVSLRRAGFAKLWWFACSLHMLSERFEQARPSLKARGRALNMSKT